MAATYVGGVSRWSSGIAGAVYQYAAKNRRLQAKTMLYGGIRNARAAYAAECSTAESRVKNQPRRERHSLQRDAGLERRRFSRRPLLIQIL